MRTHEISSYILRTTDPDAATAFYDAVLGHHGDTVYLLHENARARGAQPHWLGHVETDEPELLAAALLADGGQRLGPRPGGGLVLRDPGGALIALGPSITPSVAGVVWHVLRTHDAARAEERYARIFGWSLGERTRLSPGGDFRSFAWRAGTPDVGAIAGIEDTPGVHPQWLYFFGVSSFDAAVAAASSRGARLLPTGTHSDGRRFVVGDDPQGAAFGLMER